MEGRGLTAANRIRRRAEFERIYAAGARSHGRYMTLFVMVNGAAAPRLGVAATRKHGSAVDRTRELFRRR